MEVQARARLADLTCASSWALLCGPLRKNKRLRGDKTVPHPRGDACRAQKAKTTRETADVSRTPLEQMQLFVHFCVYH